jgi:hypothetical protein
MAGYLLVEPDEDEAEEASAERAGAARHAAR